LAGEADFSLLADLDDLDSFFAVEREVSFLAGLASFLWGEVSFLAGLVSFLTFLGA